MSSKPTITEFLLARIGEDEARARRVLDYDDPPEQIRHLDPHPATLTFYESRVLAECAAKRAIVGMAREATGLDVTVDDQCRTGGRDLTAEPYLGDLMLRALAAVYADHPDYDPEWAA